MDRGQEIAWAAGLYEGEGCASVVVNSGHKVARLALDSTDPDVLERFQRIVGEGSISGPDRRGTNKPIWRWSVQSAPGVIRCLRLFNPYLGARRRAQSERALEVAWKVLGRKVVRHARPVAGGVLVRASAAKSLAHALGKEF